MKSKKNTSNPLLPLYGVLAGGSLILSLVIGAWICCDIRGHKWEVGKCYEGETKYYRVTEIKKTQFELDDKVASSTVVHMYGVSKPEVEDESYSEDFQSGHETTEKPTVNCSLFHAAVASHHMKKAMANLDKMEKLISEIQRKSK